MSLDRIRWLVPTESIDEFVDLWVMETKRNVPNRDAMINVAAELLRPNGRRRIDQRPKFALQRPMISLGAHSEYRYLLLRHAFDRKVHKISSKIAL